MFTALKLVALKFVCFSDLTGLGRLLCQERRRRKWQILLHQCCTKVTVDGTWKMLQIAEITCKIRDFERSAWMECAVFAFLCAAETTLTCNAEQIWSFVWDESTRCRLNFTFLLFYTLISYFRFILIYKLLFLAFECKRFRTIFHALNDNTTCKF